MSTSLFRIHEHILPCQHIRHYPRSTANSQEDVLHLAINQYTPLDNQNPGSEDVTIIAAHANGVGKELYEPLWDECHQHAKHTRSFRIRSIWIADVSHQGASFVLNEGKVGNDREPPRDLLRLARLTRTSASWYDHSRDLLQMINSFREQMPRPLVGVGHSMGGNSIVNLSLMHPRLLESVILIYPVIQRFANAQANYTPTYMSAMRRDIWPSREEAAQAFRKNKFYQRWDPRVLNLWIKYGLRNLPTALYPSYAPTASPLHLAAKSIPTFTGSSTPHFTNTPSNSPVTLTTTKHQEVFTFARPNFPPPGKTTSTYRPEPIITFFQLPHLRSRCFYIWADESPLSSEMMRKDKLELTGTGVGGNGGVDVGAVAYVLMEGAGHFVPFEKVQQTADHMGKWLGKEMERWRRGEEEDRRVLESTPVRDRTVMSEQFIHYVRESLVPSKAKETKSKI